MSLISQITKFFDRRSTAILLKELNLFIPTDVLREDFMVPNFIINEDNKVEALETYKAISYLFQSTKIFDTHLEEKDINNFFNFKNNLVFFNKRNKKDDITMIFNLILTNFPREYTNGFLQESKYISESNTWPDKHDISKVDCIEYNKNNDKMQKLARAFAKKYNNVKEDKKLEFLIDFLNKYNKVNIKKQECLENIFVSNHEKKYDKREVMLANMALCQGSNSDYLLSILAKDKNDSLLAKKIENYLLEHEYVLMNLGSILKDYVYGLRLNKFVEQINNNEQAKDILGNFIKLTDKVVNVLGSNEQAHYLINAELMFFKSNMNGNMGEVFNIFKKFMEDSLDKNNVITKFLTEEFLGTINKKRLWEVLAEKPEIENRVRKKI